MAAPVVPYQDLLTPDPPSAGQDFIYTVPGDERAVIVCVMCELICAAGGADRGVSLQFKNWNGRRFLVAGTRVKVAGGTTQAYVWQNGVGAETWNVDDAALAGMPEALLLPMCTATIHISGVQAGDQLSNIALLYERYPLNQDAEGPTSFPLLDALAQLDVSEIADEVRGFRSDVRELAEALTAHRFELDATRRQRIRMAGVGG